MFLARAFLRHAVLCFLLPAGWLLLCSCAQAQDKVEANPARPTVSTPATLTPVGYLQFETGMLGAEHSEAFANRTSLEEAIKLSVHKRLQLVVAAEPVVFSDQGTVSGTDPGGVLLGAQGVLLQGHERRPTIAVSYFRTVYNGSAPDLDIGSSVNAGLMLFSFDFGKFHIDTNYIFNEQSQNAVHRLQYAQTLAVSHPIRGKLGFTGEIWHFSQPFLQSNAVGLLLASSYTPKPNLVLDLGFNHGLTSSSTRWAFFAGFTYLLPKKLW
jgi:hypothetical protein